MDKKNEESLQSLSPYFSPLFLSAFSAYSSRFKKERTRREYLRQKSYACSLRGVRQERRPGSRAFFSISTAAL